ncbi:hypothetical protein Clacol_003081 [Clathrus columnatus]|uniref:Uncharacterized protein n=1 Tax=Clathrus columnatus TaxID=1419009 RepID=A0AAV5A776_9AGAM|nr:hypothetical protein Clacol_003081 [Clathrus columnatus]
MLTLIQLVAISLITLAYAFPVALHAAPKGLASSVDIGPNSFGQGKLPAMKRDEHDVPGDEITDPQITRLGAMFDDTLTL